MPGPSVPGVTPSGPTYIPQNAQLIYKLLTAAGLSKIAAAGILGNIYQESGGDTQAGSYPGSYGLIQWTPAQQPTYTVPNNSSVTTQVGYILKYIAANGSISAINKASTSPSAAALYFSNVYERPLASAANNPVREASADAVYQAAISGKWPSAGAGSASNAPASPDQSVGSLSISTSGSDVPSWISDIPGLGWLVGTASDVSDIATALQEGVNMFTLLFKPSLWFRVGAFFAGIVLLSLGIYMLAKTADPDLHLPSPPPVMPIPVPV